MRLFFSLLFCIIPLFLHSSVALSPFEGDPAGTVCDSVDVITGSFLDYEEDLVVQAPTPLVITRSYSSQSGTFHFFPHCSLVVEGAVARTYEPQGSPLAYRKKSNSESEYILDVENHPSIANTAHGILSASTNLKNNSLELTQTSCILTFANGTLRHYEKTRDSSLGPLCTTIPSNGVHYRLQKETLPSGNKILYTYDNAGFLFLVQAVTASEAKVFGSISIRYHGPESDQIKVLASNGQFVSYGFNKGLLHNVKRSSKPELSYSYVKISKRDLLAKMDS